MGWTGEERAIMWMGGERGGANWSCGKRRRSASTWSMRWPARAFAASCSLSRRAHCWRFTPSPFRPRSEEHTSELQSLMHISNDVLCLKKKNNTKCYIPRRHVHTHHGITHKPDYLTHHLT